MDKKESKEREKTDTDELLDMVVKLTERVVSLESKIESVESSVFQYVSMDFEKWLDAKVRGYEYGPELKAEVMPKVRGRGIIESKKIFFECKDKLFAVKYPNAPRGPQTYRW